MDTAISRRTLAGLSGAGIVSALLGLRVATAQDASPVTSPAAVVPVSGDTPLAGIAGGGTLTAPGGDVAFSLAVFLSIDASGETVVQGSFLLNDRTEPSIPVEIEGIEFTEFEQLTATAPEGRRIVGWATLNGQGEYPFLLQVEDLGAPGSGEDQFNLVLGADAAPFLSGADTTNCDCGGFSYSLRSAVVTGDLALFNMR